jgi:hypothetical protein
MHDQYQALKDYGIEATQINEQRLQIFFTLVAAVVGLGVALPARATYLEIALPLGLLVIGSYTFANVTYYAWYKEWLKGQLDLFTIRWTADDERRDQRVLLLKGLWEKVEPNTNSSDRLTVREVICYSLGWRQYYEFVSGQPHIALVALINSGCVGILAFQALSTLLPGQHVFAASLLMSALAWGTQALYCRIGTIHRVEASLKKQYGQLVSGLQRFTL